MNRFKSWLTGDTMDVEEAHEQSRERGSSMASTALKMHRSGDYSPKQIRDYIDFEIAKVRGSMNVEDWAKLAYVCQKHGGVLSMLRPLQVFWFED